MRKMIDTIAETIAVDFLMDGERAVFGVATEFHVRGVETGFAFNKIADGGVFFDHLGPERISGETEKISPSIGGDFDNDVSPAS